MSVQQGMPAPQVPVVDAGGAITLPWLRLLQALWIRTGGASGSSSSPGGAARTIPAGASPFTYAATAGGTLSIAGNGVQAAHLVRGGVDVPVASHYGLVPMLPGDSLVVTFSGSPNFTWLPN